MEITKKEFLADLSELVKFEVGIDYSQSLVDHYIDKNLFIDAKEVAQVATKATLKLVEPGRYELSKLGFWALQDENDPYGAFKEPLEPNIQCVLAQYFLDKEKQVWDFSKAKHLRLLFDKPRRCGFSFFLAFIAGVMAAKDDELYGLAVSGQKDLFQKDFKRNLSRFLPEFRKGARASDFYYNSSASTYELGEVSILTVGTDRQAEVASIGQSPYFVFGDEVDVLKKPEIMGAVMTAPLKKSNGFAILGSTPRPGGLLSRIGNGDLPLTQLSSESDVRWVYIKTNIFQIGKYTPEEACQVLYDEYVSHRTISRMSHREALEYVAREYLNYSAEGMGLNRLEFPMFKAHKSEILVDVYPEGYTDRSRFDYYWLIDYGQSVSDAMAGVLLIHDVYEKQIYCVEEFSLNDSYPLQAIDKMIELSGGLFDQCTFWIDPTVNSRDYKDPMTGERESVVEQFEKCARERGHEIRINYPDRNNNVDKINEINFMFEEGYLKILKHCRRLIEELENLRLDFSADISTQLRNQRANHVSDSYGILYTLFNFR
jgi:hypothetical protein